LPQPAPGDILIGLISTVLIGVGIGYLSAKVLIEAFRQYWVPENLQNPVVLMVVLAVFAVSNLLRPESGLLTVTVMGIAMVNQKRFDIHHIIEFKENLQVLLISTLFILLGARLDLVSLGQLGVGAIAFLAVIMLVARPLSVFASTWRSDFSFQEKIFISWMAPRGIVAASVASIFSLELVEHGRPEAEVFVPLTFMVIIVTVAIYGFTAGRLAHRMGLVQENPQGVLFIGAHGWARKLALHLQHAGFRVIMADSSARNVEHAIQEGLTAYHGDILKESMVDNINLGSIGNVMALTPNDEVNSLASLHFKDVVSEHHIFQLAQPGEKDMPVTAPAQLGGRTLFGTDITFENLSLRFNTGAGLYALDVLDVEKFKKKLVSFLPLFVITADKQLLMWTAEAPPALQVGQTVIGLLDPADEDIINSEETAFTPMPGILTSTVKDTLDAIEKGERIGDPLPENNDKN